VQEENIIMILLESLLMSNEYSITALNMMPMKEYATTRLMHNMSKCKEIEPQGKDAVMLLCQNNVSDSPSWQGVRMYVYCGKQGHICALLIQNKGQGKGECQKFKG
jgi:hypothetical protein